MENKQKYKVYYNGYLLLSLYAHSQYEAAEIAIFNFPNYNRNQLLIKQIKYYEHQRSI